MNDLNFYTVDLKYVNYLKDIELKERGFSRVPNVEYGKERQEKQIKILSQLIKLIEKK